ncbi:energy transducer TonB [Pyxidicoccus fallax]|uniref:Energy transducer TonB n=1 Tax=Pyxidicoccus fallax TaxID=394095 RepID=A0A848LLS3_9BACT|nr:energy transducer TonB [Pyxidicoccus fallax]NMO18603.1 energy transducer TonB [Pyxidicoccus fallax]NPC82389.1 energy transducer TonB [Pyxidicoccus fallax]
MRLPLLLCVLALAGSPSLTQAKAPPAASPEAPCPSDRHEKVPVDPESVVDRMLSQPVVDVLPFGGAMTRPERIRGELPRYTPEALAARVEGTMLLQCTVHVTGEVNDCRVLKPLKYLERDVLKAVESWRFKPATLNGKPVPVRYTLTVEMKLPSTR